MFFDDGLGVGEYVLTSTTVVFDGSTIGDPNVTVVEVVIVVEPSEIDSSTHDVAVSGSANAVATYNIIRM